MHSCVCVCACLCMYSRAYLQPACAAVRTNRSCGSDDFSHTYTQLAHMYPHIRADIRYSPDARMLATASKDTNIYLLDCTQNYRKIGVLKGHSTYVTNIDFNWNGSLLQSNDAAKEILYWDVTTGKQHTNAFSVRDEKWATWTCPLGWQVRTLSHADETRVFGFLV